MSDDNDINTPESQRDETEPSDADLISLLENLRAEHRRIDQEIKALYETGVSDVLKIGRMKKVKLSIKDQIKHMENQLTPDIIA